MRTLRRLYANIRNWYYRRKFKDMHRTAKMTSLWSMLIQRGKEPFTGPTAEYADNEQSLKLIRRQAKKLKNAKTIAFGDSLIAFCKNDLESVPPECNFARPGDTGRGFSDQIHAFGNAYNGTPVENIILGCFGNNALQYQSLEWIIQEMISAYDQAQMYFPDARIIFYAFPPVYDFYANMVYPDVTLKMWLIAGPENVITFDDMRGNFGLFPEIEYSSDGVHFGPNGKRKFDEKIMKKIG